MKKINSFRAPGMQDLQGLTLIEVLVSLGLFSVGVLGFIALQATAASLTLSSDNVTRAALLANELTSQMQTYGNVNVPPATLTAWQNLVTSATNPNLSLPSPLTPQVTFDSTGTMAMIVIQWQEVQRKNLDNSQITSQYKTVYAVN